MKDTLADQNTQKALEKLPALYATEGKDWTNLPAVKLFTPDGAATWLVWEYDAEQDLGFGWADLGLGFPELGYISLAELRTVRGPFGLAIERDKYFSNTNQHTFGG